MCTELNAEAFIRMAPVIFAPVVFRTCPAEHGVLLQKCKQVCVGGGKT